MWGRRGWISGKVAWEAKEFVPYAHKIGARGLRKICADKKGVDRASRR